MKAFSWSAVKNEDLKRDRGVCFEQVVFAIESGRLLDILEHPNQEKYGGQKLYVVEIEGYAYIVPFVQKGEERFLKTIIPTRRYTRIYLDKE